MFESIQKFSHYHGVHHIHMNLYLKSSMDTVKCEIHVIIGDHYVTHTLVQITNYVARTLVHVSVDTVDTTNNSSLINL